MKFWVLDYHDDNSPSGSVREFFLTEGAAQDAAKDLDANPPAPDGYFRGEPYQLDVPLKRAQLLAWLNRHASGR